jgi:glycosyltransferase involved in cell wall biosynthesis
VTIARALGEAQIAAGGQAALLVRAGLDHDPGNLALVGAPMPDKTWQVSSEKFLDVVVGATINRRPRLEGLWAPLYGAIPLHHEGPVFLHNAPGAAAALRRKRPNSQGVIYLHNEVWRGWPRVQRRRLVETFPTICVSQFIAQRLVPRSVHRGAVLTLVNGSDVDTFYPATEEPEPTVVFIGKVSPHKGPDLLVEASKILFDEGLRFRLLIVGAGVLSATDTLTPFEQGLRVAAAPLGDWVSFRSFTDRDHIADLYRSGTVAVVPSNWDEPCSLTLPEAMASGLACVASRRGGLPEVGGDAPLYFDPPDISALAGCLRRLLLDNDERRSRAVAARTRAEAITWRRQLAVLKDWLAAFPVTPRRANR